MKFRVDKIIRCPAHSGGFRVWRVTGIFLGGDSQESVIEDMEGPTNHAD